MKESPRSVEDTVSRLKDVLQSKGIKLFAVVDHRGEAETVGLELRDTKVVIFGSPLAGTPVMSAAPLAALDRPLKVLVWADGDQTKLSYDGPHEAGRTVRAQRRARGQALRDRRRDNTVIEQCVRPTATRVAPWR